MSQRILRRGYAAALLLCFASVGVSLAQSPATELERQIYLYLKPGAARPDLAPRASLWVSRDILSKDIGARLNALGPERVERAGHQPGLGGARPGVPGHDGLLDFSRLVKVTLPPGSDVSAALEALRSSPDVAFASRNIAVAPRLRPSDTLFGSQWGLENTGQEGGITGADVHATAAWDRFTGSPGVQISIIDPGYALASHVDFSGRVTLGRQVSPGPSYHSTIVAGIAAATGNNAEGVAGMDWQCRIRSAEITTSDPEDLYTTFVTEVSSGSHVINCSWGQSVCLEDGLIKSAFIHAYKNNALCVVAMPEDGSSCDYPNAYANGIFNVAATTNRDQRASYSHPKTYTDIGAPGGNSQSTARITSTHSSGGYSSLSGTSMAAPHVSGAAGLLLGMPRRSD
jgi:thermitase